MSRMPNAQQFDAIVIGASAGGVMALQALLSGLPADLPMPVLVVLHL
ncbi:chemotaxis protein CheB, partial [Xanthomonas vasicola]